MKFKHVIGAIGIAILVLVWVGLGLGFLLQADRQTWTYLVIAAAVGSEIFIWCLAAMLGLSIFDARRKIWRFLTSLGRSSSTRP